MTCRHFERLVVLTHMADLTDQQRAALDTHAQSCRPCAVFAAEMRTVERLLKAEAPSTPPANFEQGVMQRIRLAKAAGEPKMEVGKQ